MHPPVRFTGRVLNKNKPYSFFLSKVPDPTSLHRDLPPELQGGDSSDVGTLVTLEWGVGAVGQYANGVLAEVIVCKATAVDEASGRVIARRGFHGTRPQSSFSVTPTELTHLRQSGGHVLGEAPNKEIVAWVSGLRRG